jgi:hypothetical protein
MRKRKLMISAVAALAVSVGVAAVAQAVVTSQTITATATKTKQDRKVHGAGDIRVVIDTFETAPTPAAQTASHTNVDFDKDYKFTPGKLGQCTQAQLNGTTTDQAKANCPKAIVGTGSAKACAAASDCAGGQVDLVVTAFNGAPQGGNPVLFLHAKAVGLAAALPPLILPGVLVQSPLGAPYGKRLSVDVPDTSSTGTHLRQFATTVGVLKNGVVKKVKVKTKSGKKKIKKVPQYYVMSKCSDRQWDFRSETTFRGGAATQTDTHSIACQQKKSKKKKK